MEKYKQIFIDLIKLTLPILAGNLSQILIFLADTIVAGRYSTVALGAISVASAITMTATIAAIGIVIAISPVVSNYRGAKIPAKKYFGFSVLFSFLVSIPFFLLLKLATIKLHTFNLDQELFPYVKQYLEVCAWTVFPATIFVAIKEFLQAYEKVIFANVLMFLSVIVNLILNIILTFGLDWNFIHIQEMGVLGLSVATLATRLTSMFGILLYCIPLFKNGIKISKKYIKDLMKTGVPISFALFFEFLGFNLTAVLIGKFSALFAAVHNIILCIANVTFMICLSVSNASAVKIGFFNGKKDKTNVVKYAKTSIFIILIIAFCAFLTLSLFSKQIILIFSKDPQVIALCQKIMVLVLAFLFFDCLQCAHVGILKGLKDTKAPMFATLFGYLIIAIPLGSFLAFKKGIVLGGFWLGLALALFSVAIITGLRVVYDIKKLPYQ